MPTEMRSNPIYYRLYYVHLNTIFASVIPLISLIYLNISTVKALKQMIRQDVELTTSRNSKKWSERSTIRLKTSTNYVRHESAQPNCLVYPLGSRDVDNLTSVMCRSATDEFGESSECQFTHTGSVKWTRTVRRPSSISQSKSDGNLIYAASEKKANKEQSSAAIDVASATKNEKEEIGPKTEIPPPAKRRPSTPPKIEVTASEEIMNDKVIKNPAVRQLSCEERYK